jgi:choline dehydrogenase
VRAHACKVLFDAKRATGVEIDRGGRREQIGARREVIVAAGAVNSPQLLQLSGVGPSAHLKTIGVDVLSESPAVGSHLQDHIGINYTYRASVKTLNDELRSWSGKLVAGLNFLVRSRGPLSISLNQGGGFVRTRSELARPNIQLYLQAISTLEAKSGTRPLLTPDPFPGFSLGLSNCKPVSRGAIMARTSDPFAPPRIAPNALSAEADVQDMLEGVQFLRKLAAQPALKAVISEELAPGPKVVSQGALIADFRARAGTVYHPVGTCRMGRDAKSAVVDARLRAHGLEGLRVADASIFPSIISGNTNAAVMMVGAKAAAMILEDAR